MSCRWNLSRRGCSPDERLELRDEPAVAAELEVGLDAVFQRGQAKLLEARDLALGEALVRELSERLSTPLRERFGKQLGRALGLSLRERAPPQVSELGEAVKIELALLHTEQVARRARDDGATGRPSTASRLQQLPKLRDLDP